MQHGVSPSRTSSFRSRAEAAFGNSVDVISRFARSPSRRRARPVSASGSTSTPPVDVDVGVDTDAATAADSATAAATASEGAPALAPAPSRFPGSVATAISSSPPASPPPSRQSQKAPVSASPEAINQQPRERRVSGTTVNSVDRILGLYLHDSNSSNSTPSDSSNTNLNLNLNTNPSSTRQASDPHRDMDGQANGGISALASSTNVNASAGAGAGANASASASASTASAALSAPVPLPVQMILQNATTLYQHIHDMSNKRIATLNYLRRVHQGQSYYFNTVRFSHADIARLPSYSPSRLSRRATNFMLLGMSIPAVLDTYPAPHPQSRQSAHSNLAADYLRSLHALLSEFEAFQQLHPTDGSSTSSLTRARIPHMFKRSVSGRPRKSSSAPVADIGAPMPQSALPDGPGHAAAQASFESSSSTYSSSASFASSTTTLVAPTASSAGHATFPPPPPADAPNSLLLPNEGPYTYLLTPPLPFTPDFFAVFSTLCDVLIDAYQRLQQLLSSPAICTPALSDNFNKVDARLRKFMVAGIVREFEQASRDAARREVAGLQRVVLGGLMG